MRNVGGVDQDIVEHSQKKLWVVLRSFSQNDMLWDERSNSDNRSCGVYVTLKV